MISRINLIQIWTLFRSIYDHLVSSSSYSLILPNIGQSQQSRAQQWASGFSEELDQKEDLLNTLDNVVP